MAAVAVLSCVSLARPVAPTTYAGPLPAPVTGRQTGAEATPEATDGPLYLAAPRFEWIDGTAGSYRWSATLRNPSHTDMGVTVVLQILDAVGTTLHHEDLSRMLRGGRAWDLESAGQVPGERLAEARSWQIEYWVRISPPPHR